MKTIRRLSSRRIATTWIHGALGLALAAGASAQSVPAQTANAGADAKKDETIVLSPFEGRSWVNFIGQRASLWAANSALTGPNENNTTIASRYLNIIQVLNQMSEADGQKVENGREWRVNLVTRYAFTEGVFRGAFAGTGYRWRSPQVIGYRAELVTNRFTLPGAPAEVLVPSREAPIEGKVLSETELFFGYTRRFGKRVNWRVQLNIRNILDNQDRMEQRANISQGFVTVYAIPEPRSFILTNTFTF